MLIYDACWLVRKEIVYSLQLYIAQYQKVIIKDFQKIVPSNNPNGKMPPPGRHNRPRPTIPQK